ncbi:MAG TPA: hypothetical protein VE177_02150 [Candidatus Binatus sp.]|nr:hypothetical protein [Candidatus Binatus sp.]
MQDALITTLSEEEPQDVNVDGVVVSLILDEVLLAIRRIGPVLGLHVKESLADPVPALDENRIVTGFVLHVTLIFDEELEDPAVVKALA